MYQQELFGEAIYRRVKNHVNGYATTPGTGPVGETCRSCKHLRHRCFTTKTYLKCALVQVTNGPGTDIRAKSPACSQWEKNEGNSNV